MESELLPPWLKISWIDLTELLVTFICCTSGSSVNLHVDQKIDPAEITSWTDFNESVELHIYQKISAKYLKEVF